MGNCKWASTESRLLPLDTNSTHPNLMSSHFCAQGSHFRHENNSLTFPEIKSIFQAISKTFLSFFWGRLHFPLRSTCISHCEQLLWTKDSQFERTVVFSFFYVCVLGLSQWSKHSFPCCSNFPRLFQQTRKKFPSLFQINYSPDFSRILPKYLVSPVESISQTNICSEFDTEHFPTWGEIHFLGDTPPPPSGGSHPAKSSNFLCFAGKWLASNSEHKIVRWLTQNERKSLYHRHTDVNCTEGKQRNPQKIAPWSSRWFEEISLALIWLALISLTLICLAPIWLTLIWLTLIWLTFFVKILTFFT